MRDRFAVGRRILAARLDAGLSASRMAERLGVSVGSLRRWENGKNPPPSTLVGSVADLLKVSRTWLLTGEGPRQDGVSTTPADSGRLRTD